MSSESRYLGRPFGCLQSTPKRKHIGLLLFLFLFFCVRFLFEFSCFCFCFCVCSFSKFSFVCFVQRFSRLFVIVFSFEVSKQNVDWLFVVF